MYSRVRSRVKLLGETGDIFESFLGVRQGESLSPFIFSMYLNDLEEEMFIKGSQGIDIGALKLFLLMYADDIVIFANSAEELQSCLNILSEYCSRQKLSVNRDKTKVVVFRKGGRLPGTLAFYYDGHQLEIVNKYTYLGIVFTSGGSFSEACSTLL